LSYSIHLTLKYGSRYIPIKTKYSDPVRKYVQSLQQLGTTIVIPTIVEKELYKNLWDALTEVLQLAGLGSKLIPPLLTSAQNNFNKLKAKCDVKEPSEASIKRVREFYQEIWECPSLQFKREIWAGLKKKPVSAGPPGGADVLILATALDVKNDVEFLTLDNDFLVFTDEIKETLGIVVRDASML